MATDTATSNGSRLIGPLLGGAVYQWIGGVGIFAIAAGLYALALFLMMSVLAFQRSASSGRLDPLAPFTGAWQAIRYASETSALHPWCHGGVQYLGFPMLSMVPVIGKEELDCRRKSGRHNQRFGGRSALIGIIARFVQPPSTARFISPASAPCWQSSSPWPISGLTTLVLGLIEQVSPGLLLTCAVDADLLRRRRRCVDDF